MPESKRVILRLSETDFNAFDMYEAVRAYLERHDRSATELEGFRHWIHIRLSNDHILQRDPKVNFIVDLEMDLYSGDERGRVERDFPHELFGVRRGVDGQLSLFGWKNELYFQDLLRRVREVTEQSYVWGD